MQRLRTGSSRNGRIAIAAAVLASVLVIAVGGGYSASRALLADGVAFAVDGQGLDRLNAATGTPEAEIVDLAKGTGRIRSVHRDGQLYVVDTATNTVSQVDPATLEIGPTTPPKPGLAPDQVTVVAGGGTSALVDRGAGTVQRLDRATLAAVGDPVAIDGGVANAVVDADGVIWLASRRAGTVVRISGDSRLETVPVAVRGTDLEVTLVGGRPVAADTRSGTVVAIDPSTLKRSEPLPLPTPPAGRLVVSAPETPAPYLWLLDSEADALFRVDLRSRRVAGPMPLGAGNLRWGQPVVQGGRVYAPNLTDHTMAVVDVQTFDRVAEVRVPGAGPDFDVTLQGGALWANDPTSGSAVVVDQQGNARDVGKGDGKGRKPEPAAEPDPPRPPEPTPATPPPPLPPRGSPAPPVVAPPVVAPPIVAPAADATVPDLTGLPADAACAALRSVRLGCQRTQREGGTAGKVTAQDPGAGTTLRPGASVKVVVGLGVKVPKAQTTTSTTAPTTTALPNTTTTASTTTTTTTTTGPPPPPPPPAPVKVELRRYKAAVGERWRVAVPGTTGGGWNDDGLLGYCYVSAAQPPGMVSLLKYQKPSNTSYYRHRIASQPLGADWGTPEHVCWVFPPPATGGAPAGQKPLYSMQKNGNPDLWFWTQSRTFWEQGGPPGNTTYTASGITAYLAT